MTHYQARCRVMFTVMSDWVRAESEAEAHDKIRRLMGDQAATLLGIRRDLVSVEPGRAEEWVTYEGPPQKAPEAAPAMPQPMKRPGKAREARGSRAPSHKRKWAKASR
jgi:hypothetical protein